MESSDFKPTSESVASRWTQLQQRVADACRRVGRNPSGVTIVGVTKYVDADVARWLFDAGCRDFGESRPQSLWQKRDALADLPIRWHMIGHLQTNKVHKTIDGIALLHSLDSLKLAQAIDKEASSHEGGSKVNVLIEVNPSTDANKTGMSIEQARSFLEAMESVRHVEVAGLMAMSGRSTNNARQEFSAVRLLRDSLRRDDGIDDSNSDYLAQLSMGMSEDFEIAIEEGATLVRVGSFLFEH